MRPAIHVPLDDQKTEEQQSNHRPRCKPARSDRGSALVVVGIVAGTVSLGILLILGGHGRAVRAAQAQAGADAVALAGATGDDQAAHRIAALNQVTIVSLQRHGNRLAVSVERNGIERSATATWELAWVPPAQAD